MKISHLNYSDSKGGAARAAYRIHTALRNSDVDSIFLADVKATGDWTVEGHKDTFSRLLAYSRPYLGALATRVLQSNPNCTLFPAIIPSGRVKSLNACDADLLHMHWVQGGMLSVSEIGALRKPVLWTLHDMWAFGGAESVALDSRWIEGYTKRNRPSGETGFDLNRWTWERKLKSWKAPFQLVTPSNWLAQCVRDSALLGNWPVTVIPNPIDTLIWKPLDKLLARELLGLPKSKPILLFGAIGGSRDINKGFDLLKEALFYLRELVSDLHLVVFGETPPRQPQGLPFPIQYMGHLHDDFSLRVLYCAADVLAVPSRKDNLPNTGVESLACGTPVVGFDNSGLPDIVSHMKNGYLAQAFDTKDFALGIQWVLSDRDRLCSLQENARESALQRFSSSVVAAQYKDQYAKTIDWYKTKDITRALC